MVNCHLATEFKCVSIFIVIALLLLMNRLLLILIMRNDYAL